MRRMMIGWGLALFAAATYPSAISGQNTPPASREVTFARAMEIIQARCASCHSAKPSDPQFPVAPGNVQFDTAERITAMAARIKDRAVVNKTMPFLNRTQMTEQERAELGKWIDLGAKLK